MWYEQPRHGMYPQGPSLKCIWRAMPLRSRPRLHSGLHDRAQTAHAIETSKKVRVVVEEAPVCVIAAATARFVRIEWACPCSLQPRGAALLPAS
jgi:hypothetical protein